VGAWTNEQSHVYVSLPGRTEGPVVYLSLLNIATFFCAATVYVPKPHVLSMKELRLETPAIANYTTALVLQLFLVCQGVSIRAYYIMLSTLIPSSIHASQQMTMPLLCCSSPNQKRLLMSFQQVTLDNTNTNTTGTSLSSPLQHQQNHHHHQHNCWRPCLHGQMNKVVYTCPF
jgi:hypothetical protein